MKRVARILSYISVFAGSLNYLQITSTLTGLTLLGKLSAAAFAPYLALLGLFGTFMGIRYRNRRAVWTGLVGAFMSGVYIWRVIQPHDAFERAFGAGWQRRIPPERESKMLRKRWYWRMPQSVDARLTSDVVFWTIPDPSRQLLCDIWQPPAHVKPTGLAYIYLHGSGWHYLDKDVGTRPIFSHLASQGHVVMDVAYRLLPEADFYDMIGDAKRAIAWMKQNAAQYGINPDRIVIAGGSAGGHLALMAAYTPQHPELNPDDIRTDVSVRAVVSYYGITDMRYFYEYGKSHFGPYLFENPLSVWLVQKFLAMVGSRQTTSGKFVTIDGMAYNLLGGTPDDVPDMYKFASPLTHVGPHCPPTLLLQGEHDLAVKAERVHLLHEKLKEAGVTSLYVEFPQTDHAFDIIFPRVSPAAQSSIYDLERFLALMM